MGKSAAKKMHPVDPLTSEVLANQGVETNVEPVSGAIFGSDDPPAPQTSQPAPQTAQPAPIQPEDPVTGEDTYEIQPYVRPRRKPKPKPKRKGLLAAAGSHDDPSPQ